MFELLALELIVLRTVDGRDVHVNPRHVVSLMEKIEKQSNKVLSDNVQCVVGLLDGKFISAAESCDSVRRKLQGEK
jgi:hypothetical protein